MLNGQEPADFREKIKVIVVFLLVAFCILIARLGYLQIIKGDEFRKNRKIMPFVSGRSSLCAALFWTATEMFWWITNRLLT